MSDLKRTYIFETVLISGGTTGDTEFVTGATFNTGTGYLILETVSGNTINVPFDGRYSLTGHTHDISNITGFTDNSTNWDSSYDDSITGITVSGTTTKTITLAQRDGSSLFANFTDDNTGTGTGDVVTGMTFNTVNGVLELRTLSGSTIQENLDGRYLTGYTETSNTDDYVSGVTFNIGSGLLEFTRVSGDTFNVELDGRYSLTGHTHANYTLDSIFNSHTGDTVIHVSQTDRDRWDAGGTNAAFTAHTGDTSIHFTKDSINLSDLATTAHTHTVSEITDFPTNISYFTNDSGYLTGATSTDNDYVTGATFNINDGLLEFTRLSGGTFDVNLDNRYSLTGHTHNLSELNNDIGFVTGATSTADDYLSGGTFNTSTGDLSLIRLSGETIIINLDNRYLLAGPVIFSSETSGSTTYVGYGTISACKIRQIITVSGYTYTAYWSEGSETLDKIWGNRLSYSYF